MLERSEVAIVVVVRNSAAVLPGLLTSLAEGCRGIAGTRLVVVDNDSADDGVDLVHRRCPRATVVATGGNAGYAAGLNAGIAVAGPTDAVLVLNPDVRLRRDSVRRLLDAVAPAGVGIAVPRLVDTHGALLWSLRRDPTILRAVGEAVLGGRRAGRFAPLGEMVTDPSAYEHPCSVDWASGAAMLVSSECLERVGRWDESFFLYSEETDFSLRVRDAGFTIRYVPDALVEHLEGDAHVSPALWGILTVNRVRLFARRHGRLSTAAFWSAVTLNEAVRAAARRPLHRTALKALMGSRRGAS